MLLWNSRLLFWRHLIVGVRIENELDKIRFLSLTGNRSFVVEEQFPGVQRESAFCFLPAVALGAVFFENGNDLMDEIDFTLCSDRKKKEK